jgi:hypothetical protein
MAFFRNEASALCAAAILLAGCDDLVRVAPREDGWKESKHGIYDGAVRIGAFSVRLDRQLEIRCFAASADTTKRQLDIRYTIFASSSLSRIDKAFKGVEGLSLNISVDDGPATLVNVRAGFSNGDPWFLGDVDKVLVEKMRDAKSKIVALPTVDRREALDATIEFKVKDVAKQVERVLGACSENQPSGASSARPD